MSRTATAAVAGAYEHPEREIPDTSTPQLHAEVARGAVADAGLELSDVDGFLTTGAPGIMETVSMADYLGLEDLSFVDSTEIGGSSYISHVGHAAAAIAAGRCEVALITLAGRPLSGEMPVGDNTDGMGDVAPESPFENGYGQSVVGLYALAAQRHMHEFGTTSEQLAEIRVAASKHAQHNDNAMYQDPVTVEEVVESRLISDPLHLLDCCAITDGGGALVVVSPEVANELERECPTILGHGEAPKHHNGGNIDLTYTGARWSGARAFKEAGIQPENVDYASIYDSFTITVLETIEDLGFCKKGDGGSFVEDGALESPHGELPFNTDGGGLCNNHPANRGGMTKVIETVRQLRGEAHSEVQVPECNIGIAHGTGGSLGTRMGSSTLVLGRDKR